MAGGDCQYFQESQLDLIMFTVLLLILQLSAHHSSVTIQALALEFHSPLGGDFFGGPMITTYRLFIRTQFSVTPLEWLCVTFSFFFLSPFSSDYCQMGISGCLRIVQ